MKNKTMLTPLVVAMIAGLGCTHAAEQLAGTKKTIKSLAPFTFNSIANWSRDSDLYKQRSAPVCLDFLAYLNNPRSNKLFNPDGTLIHESEKIKSVIWADLDKEQYREGFMTLVNGQHPNIQAEYLKRYADPEWVLQRTQSHLYEHSSKPDSPEFLLYRLMQQKPYTRDMADTESKLELPTWFPKDFLGWLGDVQGKRQPTDIYGTYGEQRQWFIYAGQIYSVLNATYGNGKGAVPKYLKIDVYKLILDTEGHSFLFQNCALHAQNKE
ncbi:MAG: hypothetical protein ACXWIN_01970 [Burkholderiaceae bacterium]